MTLLIIVLVFFNTFLCVLYLRRHGAAFPPVAKKSRSTIFVAIVSSLVLVLVPLSYVVPQLKVLRNATFVATLLCLSIVLLANLKAKNET